MLNLDDRLCLCPSYASSIIRPVLFVGDIVLFSWIPTPMCALATMESDRTKIEPDWPKQTRNHLMSWD